MKLSKGVENFTMKTLRYRRKKMKKALKDGEPACTQGLVNLYGENVTKSSIDIHCHSFQNSSEIFYRNKQQ